MSLKKKIFDAMRPRNTRLDDDGAELLDPTPVTVPVRLNRHPTQAELIQAAVAAALAQERVLGEVESVDEMLDFDIDDDPEDPLSPYEEDDFRAFTPPEVPDQVIKEIQKQRAIARNKAAKGLPAPSAPEGAEAPKTHAAPSGASPEGK